MSVFTYTEIGATANPDDLPAGYHRVHRHERVGTGRPAFDTLARRLMSWDVQRGAGLRVDTAGSRPSPGVDVAATLAIGPIRLRAPCRVVWTVDEPRRVGFAYGTLHGHPERGEESFVASIDTHEVVWFTIAAFSRPAAWYTRLGGPIATRVQAAVTDRYVTSAHLSP